MRALDAIQGRLGELCRFLTSGYAGGGSRENMDRGVASRQLDGLMRQATGMGKAPAVAEFVNGLIRDGERPVVFAHHTEVHAILRTLLKEHSPAVYTGAESGRQRQEALRRFKDRETPLLIMGLRVGNAGLDGLQHHSRTVVLAELDWSDVIHHQCISRVDRDGQPEPVTAYVPMSKSGSDPVVADVCGVKKAQHVHIDNPDDARIPEEHVDPGHAKRLAEEWLARRK
jgi:SNF2 family DNA or RNA helicase